MSVFWLVSYPKSGNTWLRALLTNYLRPADAPASINDLVGGPPIARRDLFDDLLGIDSAHLAPQEVRASLPLFHSLLAGELPPRSFLKAHHAYAALADGTPIFPQAATAGVVYIVRHPLDVAVSYASAAGATLDRIVDWMNDPTAAEGMNGAGVLPQALGTWSEHVRGWLEQRRLCTHMVRYEDLAANPTATFSALVRYIGLEVDAERVRQAVAHSTFEQLRSQEAATGFREKPPMAPLFFRAGKAGAWRASLNRTQAGKLLVAHGPTMERLGYVDGASAPLANAYS